MPATDTCGAATYAEELRVRIADRSAGSGVPFTISVGVAAPQDLGEDAEALIAAADAALYRAKRSGRDAVRAA